MQYAIVLICTELLDETEKNIYPTVAQTSKIILASAR